MKRKAILRVKEVKNRFLLFALLFVFCNASSIIAQQLTVSGIVTDSEIDDVLIGVNVVLKPQVPLVNTVGTITGIDGDYSIITAIGDTLVFSYLGMETKEVIVYSANMNVVMVPSSVGLEEVVVIGYGTVRKKELTGAVSQLKAENIQQVNSADVASALQGQIAGVNVVAASGEPGASASIQIRGITSLNGSNTPLFVVDGIPQDGDPRLSRNEIETIDVLKDAASASIYGTRGAAGVILITTKRGKEGKTKVSLDASYGVQSINEGLPLMNAADQIYYELTAEQYVAGAFPPQINNRPEWLNNDTDLRDFVQNDGAATQSYDIGISGGTKTFSYNVVAGLFDQEGVLINSGFKRYNARVNTAYN